MTAAPTATRRPDAPGSAGGRGMGAPRRATPAVVRYLVAHAAAFITLLLCVSYVLVPDAVADVLFLAAVVLGPALLTATVRRRTHRRGAWKLLAIGLVVMAAGQIIRTASAFATGEAPEFPSVADLAYLSGMLTLLTGLFLLVRNPDRTRRSEALLDVGVFGLAGALLVWHAIIDPLLHHPSLTHLAVWVAAAYPILDVVLLAILGALLLVPRRRFTALYYLGAAGCALFVADVVYVGQLLEGGYTGSTVAELGWMATYTLLGAASLHPSADLIGEPTPEAEISHLSTGRITFLWAIVIATSATLLWASRPDGQASAEFVYRHLGATVLTVGAMGSLVLARLAVTGRALAETLVERRSLHDRLEHQARHDELTGLANRRQFTDQVTHHTEAAADALAVVFFDLDRFKEVNDQHGHTVGDELLRIVASRLRAALRGDAVAARLGGDEFAVLLPQAGLEEARVIGDRIVGLFDHPITLSGGAVEAQVGASVGVAASAADGLRGRDLVHEADLAMYASKRSGRGKVTVYTAEVHAESLSRLSLQSDLRHAVDRGELRLVFQPIVSVTDGRPFAVEALLRWNHPTRGPVPPETFIPVAEASGDIIPIGRWVLDEACRQAAVWNHGRRADDRVGVAVNVAPVQLHGAGFAELVLRTLTDTGLDGALLTLEITEGSLLEVSAQTLATIRTLRRAGVQIAVDDFGTGYSALRYLREVPLDELKIDRAFVDGIDGSVEDSALAFAILHLASTLGLRTVAEGVETTAQLEALRERGCQLAQGWLLSRPLAFAELVVLLEEAPAARLDLPRG